MIIVDHFKSRNAGQECYLRTCYADILLEKGQIKAEEIWDIYKSAPRVAQVDLKLKWSMQPVRLCIKKANDFHFSIYDIQQVNITFACLPISPHLAFDRKPT